MTEAEQVARHAADVLPLADATLTDNYYYQHVPLCVIDAVYSIGVRYEGVRNVVARYCDRFGLTRVRPDRASVPAEDAQEPVSVFCSRHESIGAETMATEVYKNRQRTSSRSGILKAEAAYRFACVLRDHGVERFQDLPGVANSSEFERDIKAVQGQRSGIAFQYFWMLAGTDDLIKPDRMILRFLEDLLDRQVSLKESLAILRGACAVVGADHPGMTPRLLDYKVWKYQRDVE